MKFVRRLFDAEEIKKEYALTEEEKSFREACLKDIKKVIEGKDRRKLLVIGPCSADRVDAVLDYAHRLAKLQEKVSDRLILIPRIYTSKPRTNGTGYKGLLHRPNPNSSRDNLYEGIIATRELHIKVIRETGLFAADEMLYPDAFGYIDDLLAYAAVGARSVENQQHRMVSSGVEIPVGMKNPTSGDTDVMLNAVFAAQRSQSYIYHGWECHSNGNPYTHAIMRGYTGINGKSYSNYHYEDLCDLHDKYVKMNLRNQSVIVDCNHANSRKHYDDQIRIAKEVIMTCRNSNELNGFVKGLMIESYLEDGSQMTDEGIYGKSITDPCLGWNKSERLVLELADFIQ